ncbi:MAG: IPExxxVDY family protein, partial [Sphingobacteriaceae bacterium]
NEPMQFSQYFYQIAASETEFYIIANRGAAGFLIPEMVNVNYFMLIKNHFDEEDLDNMLSRLKRIENIKKAVKTDPRKIKSNENLLF